MSKLNPSTLARVIRLNAAAHESREKLNQEAAAVVSDAIGPAVVQRDETVRETAYPDTGYMSPYEATVAFAVELHRAIAWHAGNVGRKEPEITKYHPAYATPAMLKDVWEGRQLCDSVGMPYLFFAQQAVMRWEALKKGRLPRPTQLCAPEVMTHVASLWAHPDVQHRHPLPTAAQDERFDPERYTADPVQESVLALIDKRLAHMRSIGANPAEVLADLLEVNISEAESRRRHGDALTAEAVAIRQDREREMQETLRSIFPDASTDEGDGESDTDGSSTPVA